MGNVRLSYADVDGNGTIDSATEILEENNYYPFGLRHQGYNDIANSNRSEAAEQYKYNGKEYEDSFGLNVTETDFRQYDSALGRFNVMDALSELAPNYTPYRYGFNNPIFWSDATGLFESYGAAQRWIDKWELSGAEISYNPYKGVYEIENNGVSFYQRGEDIISSMYSMESGITIDIIKGGASGGGGKSSFEKGLRTVADFTPIVGGVWDMVEGFENGDYLQVSIGAGSLILDVSTMGVGGTIIKGGLKKVIKEGAEELAEQGLKQGVRSTAKSMNQLNQLVKTGKAPKTITRFDIGKVKGEINHVHFDNGAALNVDGTWKHGFKNLTNKEIKLLKENGWIIPE